MAHDKFAVNITSASTQNNVGLAEAASGAGLNPSSLDFKNLFKNASSSFAVPGSTEAKLSEGAKNTPDEGLKNQKAYHLATITSKIQSLTSMVGTIDTSTPEGMALYNYYMSQIRTLEQEKTSLMPLDKYSYRYS